MLIKKEIGSLDNRKKNAENRAKERLVISKWVSLILVVVPIVIWLYYIYKSEWDNLEKTTYFPPIIWTILNVTYMMIYGKSINPIKYFDELFEKYKVEEYNKYEYSDSEYTELLKMKEDLEKEIES